MNHRNPNQTRFKLTATVATMGRHPKKRKREASTQTCDTSQDPATASASQFCQPGEAGQIQPLDLTGNWSKTLGEYFASVGPTYKCEDGKLPPISTLLKKLPLNRGVSAEVGASGDGGVGPVASVSTGSEVKLPPSAEQVVPLQSTESPDTSQVSAAEEALNPHPGGGNRPISSFTIPLLTEEDLRQMQSGRDENGYIKRPMNAFMVFSYIHRVLLHSTCTGASMIDTSVKLGSEWSKLSQEQKRPYYEVAHKLKCMHKQQFPDYEFRPQRKKSKEYLSSEQRAGQERGQGATQDPGLFFVSQDMPPAQSKSLSSIMYAYPVTIPYTVGYYPHSCACQYHPMGHYSRVKIHSSRLFYKYQNARSSSVEGEKNYHNSHLQRNEDAPAALAREHHLADVSHEVLAGSTATSESLEQPAASQHKYEDDVDVVGLLDL